MEDDFNGIENVDALNVAARSLVQRAFASYDKLYGFSTTSCQVYDSAWVAMISKTVNGEKQWLFAECFHYLLKTQSGDGGWASNALTQTSGILDTAAALLALLRHAAEPLQIQDVSPDELRGRISNATRSLHSQLATWNDILTTNHIGVEMIVPSLLEYLEKEDSALTFNFESREVLARINAAKLSKFRLESLYGRVPSAPIYSLEAFIGKIDFDGVAHHLFQGSMMASPSSTAAYLMNVSRWDEEAEAYLRHVIQTGAGHGDGGIPGTFPTTYFEYIWIVATLLKANFSKLELECPGLQGITSSIVKGFQDGQGVIGFSSHTSEVDDTAKGLLALRMLGQTQCVSLEPMIKTFERDDHFETFSSERDPSFTSNCHVLLLLLHQDDNSRYLSQIRKTVKFLCKYWWETEGLVKDKWNLSHLYPTMLMVGAFTDLLRLLDSGAISGLLDTDWQSKVSISLFQACLRTLIEQKEDGSWGGLPEQTSYAIITLAEARHVCFFADFRLQLQSAIDRGVVFLNIHGFWPLDYNWTSKTAYRLTFVAEAYLLAALRVSATQSFTANVGSRLGLDIPTAKIDGYRQIIQKTPFFSASPEWRVRASLVESALFIPLLRARRFEVYRKNDIPIDEDAYIEIIPFIWVGCNYRASTYASTSFLYDMMMLSVFSFQTDEFMETVAGPAFAGNTAGLHELIDKTLTSTIDNYISADSISGTKRVDMRDDVDGTNGREKCVNWKNGIDGTNSIHEETQLSEFLEVSIPLSRFVAYVAGHQRILASSAWDRKNLYHELRVSLHAHATQVEDNARSGCQPQWNSDTYASPNSLFFQWVHTTAAGHVSVAYSLAFAYCLMSASLNGAETFPSVREKYLAEAALQHLLTMCRMQNDPNASARDAVKRNLSSMNFPEFECSTTEMEAEAIKQALFKLAQFEKRCLDQVLGRLEEALTSRYGKAAGNFSKWTVDVFKFLGKVTDFYGQKYVHHEFPNLTKEK